MNSFERYLKSKSGNNLFYIEFTDGTVKRMKERDAYPFIKQGIANYCSKTKFRAFEGTQPVKKIVEKEETRPVHGLKAKDRKKLNKKS